MTPERINSALAVGDRICLWLLVLGFAGAFIWFAVAADRASPTLISPVCVDTPVKGAKP
jgi:hypothetical protein